MKLGINFLVILLYLIFSNFLTAEQKINVSPLINIDKIKPSFEDLDEKNQLIDSNEALKKKKRN